MLLAFDDTDSPQGGCTTHLVAPVLEAIGPDRLDGHPRLVRLDPMNPYKTRGNAAVVIPIASASDEQRILEAAFDPIERSARLSEGKGAGLILLREPPPPAWYERGVRDHVALDQVREAIDPERARTLGTGRGLVGAFCAAAWQPGSSATYERIAYREPSRWGTPREVDAESLRQVEDAYDALFDCVDEPSGHSVMVPRTPCPVLYGLRATDPTVLDEAAARIESEPVARATTFVTNQASDDHIQASDLEVLQVTDRPEALAGGHVRLPCQRSTGDPITCMAYEPTGTLRAAVRRIEPGDRVLPVGSTRNHRQAPTVNLEKLLHLPGPRRRPTACPSCARSMRSTGRTGPLRCPGCGARQEAETTRPEPTWYEADASARRHLARPLALGLAPHIRRAADDLVASPQARPQGPTNTLK